MNVARKHVSHQEEVSLIEQLRSGEARAQTQLVRRHHAALVRQAFMVLDDESLAEEVVQDSWIAAFRGIASFDGRSSVYTWLVRIVVNKARSRRGRERRFLPMSALARRSSGSGSSWADDEMELLEVGTTEATPERLLLEQEVVERFDVALRALPPSQRTVVVLRDLEGASSTETCQVLRITDLTQRVRLSRGRATLRSALQDDRRLAA
jgi:RNA polymerase sigma-70 factor, ECF subfamily